MKSKTLVALLLCAVMLIGMLPMSTMAYYEETFPDEGSLEVCTEGKTYSLFTEDGLDDRNGMTFLYVVKSGDRYYTLGNPRYSKFEEVDSVAAIDITEYYDAETNSFSGISNNVNIGVMQYQQSASSYMYVDGNMLFALSVPFESEGETWFDGGIRYYKPSETYSYSRPLWHANGDGSGYLYDSYIDWIGDSDTWVYGVLDLKYTGTHYVFSLRDKSDEYNEVRNADPYNYDVGVNVKAYLYAAPCGHEQNVHGNADAPTCMEKGCEEYWYCRLCDTYFKNSKMTEAYDGFPEIDALGHDWIGGKCNNCNRPVPVYSKVTNKTDFFALADDTMYVLVAEYEGKYYTPDSSLLYSYVFDLDEDGYADIYNVDENNNGTPDVAEIDWDGNGVYDLWEHQTEEERREYFDSICHGYLTDMLYGQTVGIPVKEITLNPDGTISHDAAKDALEFEMIKLHAGEDDLDYTFECVMQFVVPNTFINSPGFIPEDRPYGKLYPDAGDTYYWAVLFYNDRDSYYTYDWENDEYVSGLPFLDVCKEGSIALSKSWNTFSPEFGEQLGCLRLRDYNGKLSFVVGADYDLDGSEWIDDESFENGGYYDTNDTQACVYLYASAPYEHSHVHNFVDGKCECGERDPNYVPPHNHVFVDGRCECGESDPNYVPPHVHVWSDWKENGNNGHTRRCECGESQSAAHRWNDGVVTKQPTETEEGIKTYTCQTCLHTKTETINKLTPGHTCVFGEWMPDPEDSMKHIRVCECGNRESGDHAFGDWTKKDENYHTHSCSTCGYSEDFEHSFYDWIAKDDKDHIHQCMECDYNSILPHDYVREVTKQPTFEEKGEVTYTCQLCSHFYTEELPKCIVEIENSTVDIVVNIPENSEAYIPEGTTVDVVEVPETDITEEIVGEIELKLEGGIKPLACYDISLLLEGAEIQPDGTIIVTLPALQFEYDYDKVIVVYIAPDGSVEECKTTVNEDGTVSFETNHFSRYALVGVTEGEPAPVPTPDPDPKPESTVPTFVWIIIIVAGVAIIVACVVGPLFKKNGADENAVTEKNEDGEISEDPEAEGEVEAVEESDEAEEIEETSDPESNNETSE